MPSKSLEDLEDLVGETRRTVVDFEVKRGKIVEFARAIGDPAAIYLDEDAARAEGYETIPAPPTFPRTSFFRGIDHRAWTTASDPTWGSALDAASTGNRRTSTNAPST